MTEFTFPESHYQIRADLSAAYRAYWAQLGAPGTWWTGTERVAIAEEVRQATRCSYCAERKNALSPYTFDGEHTSAEDSPLSAEAVDAVHRVVTDQTRITKAYIDEIAAAGLSQGHYVELVGIVVCVFSIDEFCRGLGLPLEPLPEPVAGEPTRYVPDGLESDTAMVGMIGAGQGGPNEQDLWPDNMTANVIRALSQVPNAVREWCGIGDAQYLAIDMVRNPGADTQRAINRMQMEIIAGRVSSHNECFY